ncbi:Lipoprotein [Pseudomonas wadenswilerensis]|uniref:Lipoprotein n=1 Tax=Pseudomonas wadenswilerensis TaxID=1785161 RepID=A0A380SYP5_9PSED|nr:hypothetical protein CCOS864_02160 [Pseudomonas wadenswilerensis]
MLKQLRLACAIASLLLISGCQSYSPPQPRVVAAECQPPPAPPAWFMEPREANLTQRLLNELSPSPMPVTRD